MNKRLIILTIACLCLGFGAGVITTRMATKKRIHRMMEMQQPPKFLHKLKSALDLTEKQEVEFEAIFDTHMQKVRTIRKAERAKMKAEFDTLFQDLESILTEDQKPKLKEMEQHIRKNRNRMGGPEGREAPQRPMD